MDALIIVALITAIGGIIVAIIQNVKIRQQFTPNGGSSMRDQLNRIETNQKEHQDLLMEHHRDIGVLNRLVGIGK